jgi:polysaccharide deacetylase family protein (PEP-CTERM system associated)
MPAPACILSFDIEEHHRIEAAAHVYVRDSQRIDYAQRMEESTRGILQLLDRANCHATFFILGDLAKRHPDLVRDVHQAGHEVASHGWDHTSLLRMTRQQFRDDICKSKDTLEQIIGAPVFGYRAPTFSIVAKTAWAIDELLEAGFVYDSSLFPIYHDRYGVPGAPRIPFRCYGPSKATSILEFPPLTLRLLGANFPLGGGGYFRLLPLQMIQAGLSLHRRTRPSVSMLYFHPWEFDRGQPQLPLRWLSRLRTYAGISRTEARLSKMIRDSAQQRFRRAIDVARELDQDSLPTFHLASAPAHDAVQTPA